MAQDIDALKERIAELEAVCAQAYQLADAVGAPVGLLANLAAAAAGEPIPYATFLPIGPAEVAELLRELNNPSTGREKG